MSSTALWVLIAAALVVPLGWVVLVGLGMVAVKSRVMIPVPEDVEQIEESELPGDLIRFVSKNSGPIERLGMHRLGTFRVQTSTYRAEFATFAHHNRRDLASVIRITHSRGERAKSSDYVAFETHLVDGRVIVTYNGEYDESIASRLVRWAFPQQQDPGVLHRIHQAAVSRAGGAPRHHAHHPGRWLSLTRESVSTWVEALQRRGFARRDPATGRCHFTFRGALRFAIMALPPVSTVRRAAAHRRGQALLRELGVPEFSPAPTAPEDPQYSATPAAEREFDSVP
jgi:hypothetical protein